MNKETELLIRLNVLKDVELELYRSKNIASEYKIIAINILRDLEARYKEIKE